MLGGLEYMWENGGISIGIKIMNVRVHPSSSVTRLESKVLNAKERRRAEVIKCIRMSFMQQTRKRMYMERCGSRKSLSKSAAKH